MKRKTDASTTSKELPARYVAFGRKYKKVFSALSGLGKAVREAGPLDEKTGLLIQLAAAAAVRSEGSVHSHARRALAAGATADEINHTVLLLASTIGFPAVSAALSWVEDVLNSQEK